MYKSKPKKSHLIDESDFIIVFPHDGVQDWKENYIQIVTIDPGKKNLAIVFERRYFGGRIETLSYMLVELDQHMKDVQESQVMNVKIRSDKLYINIITIMYGYRDLFRGCHWILIEKQLTENTDACIVMTTCLTAILNMVADSPTRPYVAMMSPMLKTRILAPGVKMDKKERKK